jgi:DNA-binding NarL/FixJ family response regulator
MAIRVFITDDHGVLIDGLKLVIEHEADLELAGTAASGEEVLEKLLSIPVDVMLLDINMPGLSGIETCIEVRKSFPGIKIIGLSTYDKGSIIRKMLKSGASGYVLKNAGSEELLKAIRAVHRGESYISSRVNQALLDELTKPTLDKSSFIPELTRREKQILILITEEYTTPQIAEKLFISVNTAESHRKNLLHKLNAKNVAGLVRIAMEKGLLD